ncbi:uncharacterized protein LACBIDRAFT_322663 [Laccaria bicolor S238N-H82]|uniref:Predicted protein n=1 Tax=Laccaria bicolor (strain S238N-H82 / ATCC MYA-4686) TaxID=486041 RepID=B0CX35_LACBS|nr:uncharacterized protein LACBIDRAFT_322663 [Laccaria bicolor S238N-H82]EDR13606.1 predicted protein [Laccaria bicolor S238N-H82]|eukprot:XP_001876104.1 predicted protein [Laccaria bicolor S238N-H82]
MTETYELCTRDSRALLHHQLSATDFNGNFNYVPYQQFNEKGSQVWSNLMSADWAWKQADLIAQDPSNHNVMFVPVISGSDKTTVSVFCLMCFFLYPKLYHSCLTLVFEPLKAGMTTPKVVRCPDGHFQRVIYGLGPYIADYPEQVWLADIVQNWCPKCDAHPTRLDSTGTTGGLRRTQQKTDYFISVFDPGILWDDFGIHSDIVPFTHDFPCTNIHELLSPDLLHQVIKGTFKDHLVTWVNEYLHLEHEEARAQEIIQDIDWCDSISVVPPFPGLRRFPDGRDFNQWTGDDSKALMKVHDIRLLTLLNIYIHLKVYLAAITGYVPTKMVQCLSAFLDFCYIARHNAITYEGLQELEASLEHFHLLRQVFIDTGVWVDISLPRQHPLVHYARSMCLFGSPNGLCSSITESKHIKAVKEPWRRSSRYNTLIQMLWTISQLDKMAAARSMFTSKGMMKGSTLSYMEMIDAGGAPEPLALDLDDENDENDDLGPVLGPKVLSSIDLAHSPQHSYPSSLVDLATHIGQPHLPGAFRRFLWEIVNSDSLLSLSQVPLNDCPNFYGRISVFHSAIAHFYAPSNLCGAGGMYHELIHSNPNWHGEYARYDTVFVETNPELPGMQGMIIGRVILFFSFNFESCHHSCALIHWLVPVSDSPDAETGLWVVQPEFERNGHCSLQVVSLDSIARAAHLLPIFGSSPLPEDFHFSQSLDAFRTYFVNCFFQLVTCQQAVSRKKSQKVHKQTHQTRYVVMYFDQELNLVCC